MKYFDVELFSFQHIDKGWWNVTLLRIAFRNTSWHLFMVEQNRDELFVQWFTLQVNNG